MSLSACYVTSNICKGCRDNVGGVKAAYIFGACVTGVTEDGDFKITDIAGTGGTSTVYTFAVEKETSSFTEAINASIPNGTVFYQQDLNLVFHKLQQSTRNQIRLLAQNTNLKVVVETNNGSYWYLGENFGMTLSAGSAETGTAYGDRNGYTITLTGLEREPAKELDGTIADVISGFTLEDCTYC